MSAKWVRSQQWDDQFFPSWAWPAKFLLRAFSSIWLAVLLLSCVASFGILASVPVGMIAAIPTWLVYLACALVTLALVTGIPTILTARVAGKLGLAPAWRFVAWFGAILLFAAAWWVLWSTVLWPLLKYDPATGHGVRFFGAFCDHYKATVLRRLPLLEMSELEFYSWWPIKVLLLLFVANMTIATLRRIEFTIFKAGVLTIHTGIVIIAMGSVYYSALKQEGDMLLLAGDLDEKGVPKIGSPQQGFFDNTSVSLWVAQTKTGGGSEAARRGLPEWEQRLLTGLPRYNAYGLDAAGKTIAGEERAAADEGRGLDLPVRAPTVRKTTKEIIDPDIHFRVVGYTPYGQTRDTWVDASGLGGSTVVRNVQLISNLPAAEKGAGRGAPTGPTKVGDFMLAPAIPAERVALLQGFLSVEYLEGAKPEYWETLLTALPEKAQHGLVIEIPGAGVKQVAAIEAQKTIDLPGGWQLLVKELHPEPPLEIVTKGFEGATSSVAIVRVVPPKGADGKSIAFDRYIYSRFPELNQDLLEERNPSGMPRRRPADGAIKLTYVDRSRIQLVIDGGAGGVGEGRALIGLPGAQPRVVEGVKEGTDLPIGPMVRAVVGKRYAGAERIEAPWPVAEREQERDMIGNHRAAQIAVEVSTVDKAGKTSWSTVLWVAHNPYHPVQEREHTVMPVALPDGREVRVAFGRRYHRFPNFQVALREFDMTPYPHSTQPKDFKSEVTIIRDPFGPGRSEEVSSTSLNNPLLLRMPFEGNSEAGPLVNAAGWLMSWVAPNQFKLSQTGWDAGGWSQTKAAADRGELPRPFARFTILGVGNNPGIYVIASGAVMMAVGIPYAFYVKPWLLRREKRRIQMELMAQGRLPAHLMPGANGANGSHAKAGGNGTNGPMSPGAGAEANGVGSASNGHGARSAGRSS